MKNFYFVLLIGLSISINSYAQTSNPVKARAHWQSSSMRVVTPLAAKSNLIPAVDKNEEMKDGRMSKINPIIGKGSTGDDILSKNKNKIEQKVPGRTPELVFDSVTSSSQPTDPSIGTGPNHVIAVFNTGYRIFDKSGVALTAALSPDNLFSSGSCCDLTVSYDNAADRWVLSILYSSDGHVEVAVSQGPDPINDNWAVYSFANINDYQKLSVWSDGYYMTANVNSGSAGTNDAVFVMDRTAMLAGEATAEIVAFPLPGIATAGFYSPQAFNVSNSNLPAAGNAPIVYLQDDAFAGITQDHLKIWTINVDFSTPANSTISQPLELNTTDFVSVFDGGSFSNLEQPNGGTLIDALQATVMNQAQFRKFDTHNSAVFTFTVDTDGSADKLAGIRWYELRQDGDGQPWSIFQEGTYTSPDGKHAWNGSMMMDDAGNIALGYTGMGGTTDTFVSSYYSGRFQNDDLNTLSISETLIAAGNANIPGTRYGDYGKMDIDPFNDRKFWFITEYMNTSRANVVGVFQIAPDKSDDIGIVNIDLPTSGVYTVNEDITVTIFNFGANAATNFNVSYQIDSGAILTETFTGTIASSSSADFTFSQTADLSGENQIYSIVATTLLAGDESTTNDSKTININSLFRNDVGVTAITSPSSGEGLGSEAITVSIENYGGEAKSSFDVSYTINGDSPIIETITSTLGPGATMSYTFTTVADLSTIGSYEIVARTLLNNDAVSANDNTSKTVDNLSCQSDTNTTPQTIPITLTEITSVINFAENVTIDDVNVTVNIDHTGVGDLTILLTAPDGTTTVELTSDNGDFDDNFTSTVFDDEAETSIVDGTAPYIGAFRPEGNLSDFDGLTTAGDWTLTVQDNSFGNGGQLLDWSLQFCENTAPLGIGENFDEVAELLILDRGDSQFDISLITTEITETLTLNVYNLLGQKLLDYKLRNIEGRYNYNLDMSYAPKGIYIISINNGSRSSTGKIIKR
ncbi:proprotein convertase P-domain-containing protein [Aquimarina sp. M1]